MVYLIYLIILSIFNRLPQQSPRFTNRKDGVAWYGYVDFFYIWRDWNDWKTREGLLLRIL